MKTFVIVLNYNNYSDTILCINSLIKSNCEINMVVVDNFSTDDSIEKITQQFPSICCIRSEYNGGYAYGMNYGIKYALERNADYVMILNNDTEVGENAIKYLVEIAESDNRIGIVSPKVLYMHDKNLIYSAGGEFKKWLCVGKGKFQRKKAKYFGNEDREIDFAEGSCLLVKRQVFEDIGFIPEKYFMYFEDLDFSLSVKKKFKIYYCSKAIIYHKAGGGTNWSNASTLYNFYFTRNRILFYDRFNIVWKLYVVIFSFCVISLKSLIIILSSEKNATLVKSLWNGFACGWFKKW